MTEASAITLDDPDKSRRYDVFLSHAGYGAQKQGIVSLLNRELRGRNIRVFLDKHQDSLEYGEDAPPKMIWAAATAKVVVVVLSPDYLCRVWSLIELEIALARRRKPGLFENFLKENFSKDELALVNEIGLGSGETGAVLPLYFSMSPSDCRYLEAFLGGNTQVRSQFGTWAIDAQQYPRRWVAALSELSKITGPHYHERSEDYLEYAEKVADAMVNTWFRSRSTEVGTQSASAIPAAKRNADHNSIAGSASVSDRAPRVSNHYSGNMRFRYIVLSISGGVSGLSLVFFSEVGLLEVGLLALLGLLALGCVTLEAPPTYPTVAPPVEFPDPVSAERDYSVVEGGQVTPPTYTMAAPPVEVPDPAIHNAERAQPIERAQVASPTHTRTASPVEVPDPVIHNAERAQPIVMESGQVAPLTHARIAPPVEVLDPVTRDAERAQSIVMEGGQVAPPTNSMAAPPVEFPDPVTGNTKRDQSTVDRCQVAPPTHPVAAPIIEFSSPITLDAERDQSIVVEGGQAVSPTHPMAASSVKFSDPVVHDAERDAPIVLENGDIVATYVRRSLLEESKFAYTRFDKTVRLGRGKMLRGRVYERLLGGRYRETEELVVIKKLCKRQLYRNPSSSNHIFTEISIAQAIGDRQHVVGMLEVLHDDKYLYLVMPFFGDDFLTVLANAPFYDLDIDIDRELIRTLATNLVYLTHHRVINRDYSPENIVVHAEQGGHCCPMVGLTMGLRCAKCPLGIPLLLEPQEVMARDLSYMSPEVAHQKELSFGVDVWALGCTVFCVWAQQIVLNDFTRAAFDPPQLLYDMPFDRSWNLLLRDGGLENPENVRDQVQEFLVLSQRVPREQSPLDWNSAMYRLSLVERFSEEQRSLLSGMLRIDPTKRLTARDVLNHPYLQGGQL